MLRSTDAGLLPARVIEQYTPDTCYNLYDLLTVTRLLCDTPVMNMLTETNTFRHSYRNETNQMRNDFLGHAYNEHTLYDLR